MGQILKQKDIILVPFPFSDQTGTKKRPAVVISSDGFNSQSEDLIICAMTSNISSDEYTVVLKPEDWKDGLYSESCIKVNSVLALEKNLVIKKIGRVGNERFKETLEKFYKIFK